MMSDLELKQTVDCKQGYVRSVRYNVDGSYILSCGSDRKVKLWNPISGLLLKTYGGHADEVTDARGSCDSSYIISGSLDRSIIYWDVSTAQPLRRLRCHAGGITCVAFSEDSNVAVSGGRDNLVMCWDIRTRKLEPIQTMNDAKDCISRMIVNEFEILVSSFDGCIRRYDLRKGELTCDRIGVSVIDMAQTKDVRCTLAACSDHTLRLIDNDNGELLAQYHGHKAEDFHIECGILSSDSQIVSGSAEGCAVIWDLVDEKIVKRIQIGRGVVQSLTTHPTKHDIIFANKREFQLWSPAE